MPLYAYRCPNHGEIELRHSMAAVGTPQVCPECSATVVRVVTAPHRFWPANFRPGMEGSGQSQFLDPGYQSRARDEFAEAKEKHLAREEKGLS